MRTLTLHLVALSLLINALAPDPAAPSSNWDWVSPDLDGDGLPNAVETAGWCNLTGCFQTDPQNADSDGDGLTDGEEKLFESNPASAGSPGIYVVYDDAFKTKQYYPWQQYGHRLIARGDAFTPPNPDPVDLEQGLGTNLDAVVVRRGTTFSVGGPSNGTLKIDKSLSSLTTLPFTRDVLAGRWKVSVPADGTVGRYTLRLGNKSLDLFVIFELPAPIGELTQAGLDKFLYDDNPKINGDDLSTLIYTVRFPPGEEGYENPPYTIPGNQEIKEGYLYRYQNQQFTRYLMEDYVIAAINGARTQREAVESLVALVDENTVFRNPYPRFSSWEVLHPGANVRQQCSNIAALSNAFYRAAGIPSRSIIIDWRHSTFDHANEVWLDQDWRVYRGYRKFEIAEEPDNTHTGCSQSQWPACGTNNDVSRSDWGTTDYKPWHSGGNGSGNVLISTAEDWDRGGRAYRWASWDIGRILLDETKVRTQNVPYWSSYGWTSEPIDYGSPDSWPPRPSLSPSPSQRPVLSLGEIAAEYGEDADGDGRYERLVLEVSALVAHSGRYSVWAQLSGPGAALAAGGIVAESFTQPWLAEGRQRIRLVFDGRALAQSRVDGPYRLSGVWVTDNLDPDPADFLNGSLAHRGEAYVTSAYRTTDFESFGARLSSRYGHRLLESGELEVTTGLLIDVPGPYTVEASLFDSQDRFVARARWTGREAHVRLKFGNLAGTAGPYTLRHLDLLNEDGRSLDWIEQAYRVDDLPAQATVVPIAFSQSGAQDRAGPATAITVTQFSTLIVNGNLQLTAPVQVGQAGTYRLEAWLVDSKGNLISYGIGNPQALGVGARSLNLLFYGDVIRSHSIPGPYTVVAAKVLGSPGYTVLAKADIAATTPPHPLKRFEGTGPVVLFDDGMEADAAKWSAEAPWAIGAQASFSAASAWYAGNANAVLEPAAPLDLSHVTQAVLRFHTAHLLGAAGEKGTVEVSTSGANWTTLATLATDSGWTTRIVDLSAYAGQPEVHLRFRLASAGGRSGDAWAIDDVWIAGKPFEVYLPSLRK